MLALLGSAVLVQRRALDAAADPQEDVARGAAGEEDGVRRDRGLPRLQGAGAARELSVGFAGHAGAVEPLLVVGRLPVVEAHRRAGRCPQSMVDRAARGAGRRSRPRRGQAIRTQTCRGGGGRERRSWPETGRREVGVRARGGCPFVARRHSRELSVRRAERGRVESFPGFSELFSGVRRSPSASGGAR